MTALPEMQVARKAGGAGMLELNIRGGARICVPYDLDSISSYVLLEQEDWFEEEIRFVRRWLQPGMQAVDIGANVGVYTVAMAKAVGKRGRVWAFEPTPETADILRLNVQLNDAAHVDLRRAAVSEREGTIAFSVGADPVANAVPAGGVAGAGDIECAAVTLDRTAAEQDWRAVDFIKMDVEGHEREALSGGARFLATASPLLMVEVRKADTVDLDLVDRIVKMGYDVYRLLPGPLMLAPFDRSAPADAYLLNVFACKPDRAAKLAAGGFLAGSAAGESAAPAKNSWARYLRDAPYARDLSGQWPRRPGWFAPADARTYAEGLDAFALSRDAERSPAERLAWLARAFQCVEEALAARDSVARRISCARLAAELGWRHAAVAALRRNVEPALADVLTPPAEPFLAPSARHERMRAGTDAAGWLKCALVEEFERQRAFSSFYLKANSIDLIGAIAHLPFCSAEMERRRQLVRIRHGLQKRPEPAALLREHSEDNLNPQFWSGAT